MNASTRLDSDAWVDQYGDALFRFAVSRVKERTIAEDLVQETFLAALKSGDRFKGKSSEKTWLFAILKHKIIDHFRKNRSKAAGREIPLDAENVDGFFTANGDWRMRPTHWSADPEKAQELNEFLDHFYRCLAGLPRRNAEAFVYREIDGMSTEEICTTLDIKPNNCWVMLYRARMLLRKCLEVIGIHHPDGGTPK
jgi:RNA polymerase sigma-70 factor (ECF subfamily)